MKLLFLFIIGLLNMHIYAADVDVISIDSFNEKTLKKPTIVIDVFGNPDWKYPIGFVEKKLEPPKKQKIEKNIPKIVDKPKDEFVKGKNNKYSIGASYSFMGAFLGPKFDLKYYNNYFSHGLSVKLFSSEKWNIQNKQTSNMIDYSFNIHALPQWVVNSPSHKFVDAGFKGIMGYSVNKLETSDLSTTGNGIYYGIGSFARYPIGDYTRLNMDFDIVEGTNKNFEYGSSFSVGLSFDF